MKYRKKYGKWHFPNEQINYKKNYDYYIYTIDLRGIFVIQPYSSNIVPNIDYNNPEKTFDNLLFLLILTSLTSMFGHSLRSNFLTFSYSAFISIFCSLPDYYHFNVY